MDAMGTCDDWSSDASGDELGPADPIPDTREVYSRWVDHNYEELAGAFDAMRSWLHDTISTIMHRMTFDAFCRSVQKTERVCSAFD